MAEKSAFSHLAVSKVKRRVAMTVFLKEKRQVELKVVLKVLCWGLKCSVMLDFLMEKNKAEKMDSTLVDLLV